MGSRTRRSTNEARLWLISSMALALAAFAGPAAEGQDIAALAGVPGLQVRAGGSEPEVLEASGLSVSSIETLLELQIRESRIPILDPGSWRAAGFPTLTLVLNTVTHQGESAYALVLEFYQDVSTRSGRTVPARTWTSSIDFGFTHTADLHDLRANILRMTDQFRRDFLAANAGAD